MWPAWPGPWPAWPAPSRSRSPWSRSPGGAPATSPRPPPPAPGSGSAAAGPRPASSRPPGRRLPLPPVEWLSGPVDVFHATNFVAPPTRRAATVVTIHDLTYLRFPEMVTDASARYRQLVPRALGRGAVVCTPTAAVATEVAAEYHLPPERIVVTPLGVDDAWRQATPPDPAWLAAHGLPGAVSPVRRQPRAPQEPDHAPDRLPPSPAPPGVEGWRWPDGD